MKNKIFYLILISFVILLTYLTFGIWGLYEIRKNDALLFDEKEDLKFHKKYSNEIHHLRDSNRWSSKKNEYLDSTVNHNKNYKKTILFQGDSWIESISEIKSSNDSLKKLSKKLNYNIYNAGITSFAPSLMHKQYEVLVTDFNLKPDILVIYIDQTDLGDEFCRYRHNKVYSPSGKLLRISREKYNKAVYDYTKIYEYSELKFKGVISTIFQYPYIKIRYFIKRNFFQLEQIFLHGYSNKNIRKCSFKEINKQLLNYNKEAEVNFKNSITEYLNFLKNQNNLKKILIVTFPHLNHHKGVYKINVSNYIQEILEAQKDSRIKHLNMSLIKFDNYNIEKIYQKDLASHLKKEYHTELFLKNIIKNLTND